MHTVTQIAFEIGVVWRCMRVGAVAFGLAVGDAQVHCAPSDLIVAAVFMALEAHVHAVGLLWERFLVLIAQVGDCIADLVIQIIVVAVGAGDVAHGMSTAEQIG